MCTFCYLSSISAMSLPQTNCNKFFFFSSYFGNAIATNSFPQVFFFPSISRMALPKTNWNKFFSLLFWQYHCHNSISLFFVIEKRDKPNCFSKKKYWKNKNMCTFCYLSSISAMPLPQTNCNQKKKKFHPISVMPLPQIHFHKFFFFPSISAMALPKTN